MDGNLFFLNFEGLDDSQVNHLTCLLHPANCSPQIEFPWTQCCEEEKVPFKSSSLNVHAPVFETYVSKISNNASDVAISCYPGNVSFNNGAVSLNSSVSSINYVHNYSVLNTRTVQHVTSNYSNGSVGQNTYNTYNQPVAYSETPKTLNGDLFTKVHATTFKLNPAVSCFVPSNFQSQKTIVDSDAAPPAVESKSEVFKDSAETVKVRVETKSATETETNVCKASAELVKVKEEPKTEIEIIPHIKQNGVEPKLIHPSKTNDTKAAPEVQKSEPAPLVPRSWADIVSRGQKLGGKTPLAANKASSEDGDKTLKFAAKDQESENLSVEEDNLALILGRKLPPV